MTDQPPVGNNSTKYKCLLAILSLTMICILAMHEGINNQLYTICVILIGALGGVEAYDLIRRDKS